MTPSPAPARPRRRIAAVVATALLVMLGLIGGSAPAGADAESDAAYADAAHLALVGRTATEEERGTWVAALGGGARRSALVAPVSQGAELEAQLVDAEYLGILGRLPDEGGADFWLAFLQQPGVTVRTFEARLLGSSEFRDRVGPADDDLVDAYYDVILRRAASAADRAYWVGRLEAQSASSVARAILASQEARALDVTLAYEGFLGRAVDASGLAFWTDSLRATGDQQRLWASLVVSQEFYDRTTGPSVESRRARPVSVPASVVAPD